MCQGAGGLASRFRLGRTAGSNIISEPSFSSSPCFLGAMPSRSSYLIPMSALEYLLVFPEGQLARPFLDFKGRKDLFVTLMGGNHPSVKLAVGFIVGMDWPML